MSVLGIRARRSFSLILLIVSFTATSANISSAMAAEALNNDTGVLLIDVEAGRLDATIQGRSTGEVLEAVSGATGIQFFVEPSLLAIPVSVHLEDLALEEGLKRILGIHSYVMHFFPQPDDAGRHRIKAVRVYPKGRFTAERYVRVQPEQNQTDPAGVPPVLSPEEVGALLQRHDEITRAAAAQRIAERRNGRQSATRRDSRSPARTAFQKIRRVRRLQQFKARTLARKHASEMQFHLEDQEKHKASLRRNHERQRRDVPQPTVARQSIR